MDNPAAGSQYVNLVITFFRLVYFKADPHPSFFKLSMVVMQIESYLTFTVRFVNSCKQIWQQGFNSRYLNHSHLVQYIPSYEL
jgi:hypothetical protein